MQIKIDWRILTFVLFFFIIKTSKIYLLFLIFVIIHEIAHMIIGIILDFEPISMEVTPFGCKMNFKEKINIHNKKILKGTIKSIKSIVVALAGPISNIFIIVVFLSNKKYSIIVYINAILAIVNSLPIYPLDGGRVLKHLLTLILGRRRALFYTNKISNIVLLIVITFVLYVAILIKNFFLLIGIVYLIYLRVKENKLYIMKERVYKILEKNNLAL